MYNMYLTYLTIYTNIISLQLEDEEFGTLKKMVERGKKWMTICLTICNEKW